MTYLILAAILGVIPALIAQNKGRSAFGWWIFGFLLFPIALICSFLISKEIQNLTTSEQDNETNTLRRCPYCAEYIQEAAVKCKHCHEEVEPIESKTNLKEETWEGLAEKAENEKPSTPKKSHATWVFIGILAVGSAAIIGGTDFLNNETPTTAKTQIKYVLKTEEDKAAHIRRIKELALEGRYQDAFDMTYGVSGIDEDRMAKLRIFINTEKDVPDLKTLLSQTPPKNLDQYERYARRMYIAYNREGDSSKADKWHKKWKQAMIDALYARVKKIPSYKVRENMAGYEELVGLDPTNKKFLEKYRYYEAKHKGGQVSKPQRQSNENKLIPRSMADRGKYYLLSHKKSGNIYITVHKRVGLYDTIFTETEIDCQNNSYRVVGEGTSGDNIQLVDGVWTKGIKGSSKRDLIQFVCQ